MQAYQFIGCSGVAGTCPIPDLLFLYLLNKNNHKDYNTDAFF